jgi:hypothetical protein
MVINKSRIHDEFLTSYVVQILPKGIGWCSFARHSDKHTPQHTTNLGDGEGITVRILHTSAHGSATIASRPYEACIPTIIS